MTRDLINTGYSLSMVLGGFLLLTTTNCSDPIKPSPATAELADLPVPAIIDFNMDVKPILSDRCFKCHGPDPKTREGGLALHHPDFAFAFLGEDKDHSAIVPGEPDESTLIERVFSENADEVMPPPASNLVLSTREKEILRKWVQQGAEWKAHWAFIPPERKEIPISEGVTWGENEVDQFILARMKAVQLEPSSAAVKAKLLRRVSFDLTGLPPTPEEIRLFEDDDSPDAFEKQVDRLLDSDAYGERMAIVWMELARYADTHGYQDDFERVMWPWRDWVIHAFNKNMPYDQFVTWQLAGDLMPEASKEMLIATAFNRNHKITAEGGVIPEEYRTEYVADRSQTVGTAFLGLTLECARCHDHKYDPISQKDYFSMFAFFNNIPEVGLIGMNEVAAEPKIMISEEEIEGILSFINNRNAEEEIPLMVMKEMAEPRETHVLNRGLYDQPTSLVQPAPPEALFSSKGPSRNDRLGLANWLFSEKNPLTARVAVNRLWQQLFGIGIVATSNDFGNQGALPSHPDLLDFLALKYQEDGWDTKKMLKYLVMSATYQQTSKVEPDMLLKDPENRYLARAPRVRLTAEMIRDQALMAGGLLHHEIGGPSVKPYQPEGLWRETTGGGGGSTARYEVDSGNLVHRRSLYTFWKRTVPPPNMMTFDASSRDLCAVDRQATTTPLQALVLLNDPQVIEAARGLAQLAVNQSGGSVPERIGYMFERVTSRKPSVDELTLLESYYQEQKSAFETAPEEAKAYLNIGNANLNAPDPELAAYAMLASTILNLDETISRG